MPVATKQYADKQMQSVIREHVARYRMSVLPAIARTPALRGIGRRHISRCLRKMCQMGQLGSAPLFHNKKYYYVANSSIDTDEHGTSMPTGPLSELSKIRSYAALAFCCLGVTTRDRLTTDETQQHFPALHRPGSFANYYVHTAADIRRLGFIRVDVGGHGRWDRILAKCRTDLEMHWARPEFRPFIDRGLFEITLVTTFERKAQRLQEAMSQWNDALSAIIRLCVVPELIYLIAPPQSRERKHVDPRIGI